MRIKFKRMFKTAPVLAFLCWPAAAHAQVVNITTDTTISAGATTIGSPPVPLTSAEIIVRGRILTIDRSDNFTIASLTLQASGGNPARLTHTPGTRVDLTVTGSVSVDADSSITADGKGFVGSQGVGAGQSVATFHGGGAGHGGAGADASGSSQAATTSTGLGGRCYSSSETGPLLDVLPFNPAGIFAPMALGSGGGNAWVGSNPVAGTGGAGGGAVRLDIWGSLTLNGQISARGGLGTQATSGFRGGGGSGGSIFIIANTISGFGSIIAIGGDSFGNSGGGGGGGRVAIITTSPTLDEITTADATRGGAGGLSTSPRGGSGTLYLRLGGASRGTIYIDNNNASAGETTEFYGPVTLDANMVIRNNARVGPPHRLTDSDPYTFELTVLGNLEAAANGAIYADGRGRRGSSGFSMGSAGRSEEGFHGGGGGYGGNGGNGSGHPASGGPVYGDEVLSSMLLGSGGGNAWSNGAAIPGTGGFGGGAIRLRVVGSLTLNGLISARGGFGTQATSGYRGGGGSAGSIFITANTISGSGSIVATGGDSFGNSGGGGGGGRVVVVTCSSPTVSVGGGGTGTQSGQPGTSLVRPFVFTQQPAAVADACQALQVAGVGVAGPVTYRWRKDNVPIDIAANPSAATPTLTLSNTGGSAVGSYTVVVTTACGNVTSNAARLFSADVGVQGGFAGHDGLYDNNDFIVFINYFFALDARADMGVQGGTLGSDGMFNNNDFVSFINLFFTPC